MKKYGFFLQLFACLFVLSLLPKEDVVQTSKNVYAQAEEKKRIAITFDDGPNGKCTKELLDGLKKRNVKATFFVLGENVKKYPGILRKINQDGHMIANHSYSHVQMTNISLKKAKEELSKTDQLIYALTDKHTSFFRPPYGAYKKEFEENIPYFIVRWTIDPLDWKEQNAGEIKNKVVTDAKENDIILLHDCYPTTVEAALEIIDALTEEGYEFVTVDQLILD